MTIEYLLTSGVILIVILVGIIFFVPTEKKYKGKKKKIQEESDPLKKDWEEKALRLEKRVESLYEEIAALQKGEKSHEKELMIERVKVKKLEEKLSQEREWHRKEQETLDRKGKEFQDLKADLGHAQESFSKEHALNIQREYELKELKQQNSTLNDQRREAEIDNTHMKTALESNRKEIARLKDEVAELSKKKEDVQWVAKTEYDALLRSFREKEKEFQRLERERER